MPVILAPAAWPAWLGEEPADETHLKSLLGPYPSGEMICWPVSARVGNVRNNDPSPDRAGRGLIRAPPRTAMMTPLLSAGFAASIATCFAPEQNCALLAIRAIAVGNCSER